MTGERWAWYRLSHRLRLPLQECQEKTTSTEFLEWMVVLENEDWYEKSRQDYYLAQIAAEIRQFREMFCKNPKQVKVEEFLIPFERNKEEQTAKDSIPESKLTEQVETGPEVVKDFKWAVVNAQAKSRWAAWLGVDPGVMYGGSAT